MSSFCFYSDYYLLTTLNYLYQQDNTVKCEFEGPTLKTNHMLGSKDRDYSIIKYLCIQLCV